MKTTDLYKTKSDCCGCELCSQSCPKCIIEMEADEAGFLYPVIENESNCINCKKCISVCPEKSAGREGNDIKRSFSFSLKDNDDLKQSASGGLVTEICRRFIESKGVVYGVRYSDDFQCVEYGRANKKEELERFRGSKYVQATKKGLYKKIKSDLKEGLRVLFVGLPCEISAVYHAVSEKDNLYTISLICHGPTSQKVHKDYLNSILSSSNKVSFMSVRYKLKGWKPYYIHVECEDGKIYEQQFNQSNYNTAFLYLKRPSCRTCRYKAENKDFGICADIIAGDYHGVSQASPQYNKWGVSQGSILTEKGAYLSSLLTNDYSLSDIPYNIIRTTNRGMFQPIPQRGNYNRFVKDYSTHTLDYACNSSMVRWSNIIIEIQFILAKIGRAPKKVLAKFR